LPRIYGIGELDWSRRIDPVVRNNANCCTLNLTLWLDAPMPDVCESIQAVYFEKGESKEPRSDDPYSVHEYDATTIPSRSREIARFISKAYGTTCSVISVEESSTEVDYMLILEGESIKYMTRFMAALGKKINKWANVIGLNEKNFFFASDYEVLSAGERIKCLSPVLDEQIEQIELIVIHLRKLTGQRVEWSMGPTEFEANIYAIGDAGLVKQELEKLIST